MIKSIPMNLKVVLGSLLLKCIYGTNQKDVRGRENYRQIIQKGTSVILSAWHSQLLTIVHDLRDEIVHAVAGTHKDAEIISRIATKWGWHMMRGSSKEKGDIAYKAMIRALKIPGSLVFITPDGPTGPPKIPKPGVIRAAQATGAAIIPINVRSTRHWKFTNWDTFYLEKPFGNIFIEYGKPFYFEKKCDFDLCSKILIQKMCQTENNNLHYTNNESS
tara:strand:+ start:3466 stop:4119 length:654 start_codon:yes stop_codon:yes gene_type:complete